MTGHCLAASGSIESVASVLQMKEGFLFPNVNVDTLHPEIAQLISTQRVPVSFKNYTSKILIKSSFGFGDVNCCIVLKQYSK